MSADSRFPTAHSDSAERLAALVTQPTGLTPQRLRELFAAEDAYSRPAARTGDTA